jgi:hypothetical protein
VANFFITTAVLLLAEQLDLPIHVHRNLESKGVDYANPPSVDSTMQGNISILTEAEACNSNPMLAECNNVKKISTF